MRDMKMKKILALIVLILTVCFTGTAAAETVTLTFQNVDPSRLVTATAFGHTYENLSAGMYNFDISPPSTFAGYWRGFCVDPAAANHIPMTYEIVPVLDGSRYEAAAYLLGSNYGQTTTDGFMAALVQLAVWEVVFDSGSVDLTSGNFKYTGLYADDVKALADNAVAMAASGNYTSGYYLALSGDPHFGEPGQDFIFKTPEPGTLLLMGLGIIGVAGLRRKK
jgi:PEP-CTERM motif